MITALWSDNDKWNVWGGWSRPQEMMSVSSWSDDKCVTTEMGWMITAPYCAYTADMRWMFTASCYVWLVNGNVGLIMMALQTPGGWSQPHGWMTSQRMHWVNDLGLHGMRYKQQGGWSQLCGLIQTINGTFSVDDFRPKKDDEHQIEKQNKMISQGMYGVDDFCLLQFTTTKVNDHSLVVR